MNPFYIVVACASSSLAIAFFLGFWVRGFFANKKLLKEQQRWTEYMTLAFERGVLSAKPKRTSTGKFAKKETNICA